MDSIMVITLENEEIQQLIWEAVKKSIPEKFQDKNVDFIFTTSKNGTEIKGVLRIGREKLREETQADTLRDLTGKVESFETVFTKTEVDGSILGKYMDFS